jgi:hypothetical protein
MARKNNQGLHSNIGTFSRKRLPTFIHESLVNISLGLP